MQHPPKSAPCYPLPPLTPNSYTIQSLQISEHGKSSGVLLLDTSLGAFVVKPCNQTPQDYFYFGVGQYLDLQAPTMHPLLCYSPQFEYLVYSIQKWSYKNQALYARLKTRLDFPFYQIIEYVPSLSIYDVRGNLFKEQMCGGYVLISVGICLGFDIVVGNGDRFRFLGKSPGNPNNILLQPPPPQKHSSTPQPPKQGYLLYIDTEGNMIDAQHKQSKANAENYVNAAAELHLGCIQYLRKETAFLPSQFQGLRKQVFGCTGYQYTQTDISTIMQGIIYSTKKFLQIFTSGQLQNLHKQHLKPTTTKNKETNYWNNHWNTQLKKVHINFCQLLYTKLSAIYTTYPELINAIYDRVSKIVDEGRRRKGQGQGQGKDKDKKEDKKEEELKEEESQSQSGSGIGIGNGERKGEEEGEDAKRRRWREKLVEFKNNNYQ